MNKKWELTKEAYDRAYAPYSNFKVGALLVMKDGKFIPGCNVENASYGLTNCAERTALFSSIALGYHKDDIVELLIMSNSKVPAAPCGACRQVILELMPLDAKVYMRNLEGVERSIKVIELLPLSFTKDDLNDE